MISLKVNLGERSYPICIGQGLLDRGELLTQYIPGNSALIITNEVVAPLYAAQIETALHDIKYKTFILPDGEQYKSQDTLNSIYVQSDTDPIALQLLTTCQFNLCHILV